MLAQQQQQLRACKADVHWVAISSIHLTLKFIGEMDPIIVPKVAESLRHASKSEHSLTLRLHGLGAFPSLKKSKIYF